MKDSEFLELLNLYLDHEITPADAARLESEVQANAKHRHVYQDYCRMQKACTLLAKDFVDQPAEKKILAFEPRRVAWGPGRFAAGGLAVAAACVAVVLVNRAPTATLNTAAPAPAQTLATVSPTTAVPVATTTPDTSVPASVAATHVTQIAAAVTVPAPRVEGRPMLTSLPLTLATTNSTNVDALLAAAQQSSQAQFEWLKNMQFAPIQQLPADGLRLDARSPLQPASRTYSSGRAVQGTVEMTAFKFQR